MSCLCRTQHLLNIVTRLQFYADITEFVFSYPKDSDKHMLAKQTGLTRSQVINQ